MEVLFNTSHLSDVGCTYRLLRRETARDVAAQDEASAEATPEPEIMLLTILSGARFVEVPVNYLPRVGVSSVTGNQMKAVFVGLRMIELVLRNRFSARSRRERPPRFVAQRAEASKERDEQLSL